MNCIEKLHFDAIGVVTNKEVWIYVEDAEESAKESAAITQSFAIEFAEWLDCNYNGYTFSELYLLYQEFLKSIQPNDGIQTS